MMRWLQAPAVRRTGIALVVVLVVIALGAYRALNRRQPAARFQSDEEHFLYGSIGTEETDGVPYWIWLVLPRIFPEYLPGPGGYASLGMLSADGRELPIGLSSVTIGVPRVGINCAFCHTTSVRTSPDAARLLVPGGPANQVSVQGYLRFLFACASDPRFTADVILAEIARNHRFSATENLLYKYAVIPKTREHLLALKARYYWTASRPDWGAGRVDPFNPAKFSYLEQPIDESIGTSDMMPLWSHGRGPGNGYHWDGLNSSLQEVVLSSALGDGTPTTWLDSDFARWNRRDVQPGSSLRRVHDYISQLRPPTFPLPVEGALSAEGESIYRAQCASCHEPGSGTRVVPIAEVGTDPERLRMWTASAAKAYNAYGAGRSWMFKAFTPTSGYVAVPLDGIWLRGPFLHNGSVPTVADLLMPQEARPRRFWRGFDLLDAARLGFVSSGIDAERTGTLYDTTLPGNGNGGHLYGTTLSDDSKRALVEYLKTR